MCIQRDFNADQSYTYDVLDRITGENSTLGNLLFTYDENGNRLNKQRNTKNRPYEYTEYSNQLISVNNRVITLDAVGNTLSDKNGKRIYTYNQRNQLATFSKKGQLRARYQYNAYNQRTSKQHTRQDGTKQRTFHYQYDRFGNLIGEYKTNKKGIYKPKRTYIWLNNEPVAQIVYKFNSSADIRETTYITTDHLNTPRIGTDETQEIAWRWDSDAFGQAQPNKDPDNNANKRNIRLRFPGQYKDGESGLYYNWHRYYDKGLGRYITSDPIGLQGGLNTYGYVSANPLTFIDPRGQQDIAVPAGGRPIGGTGLGGLGERLLGSPVGVCILLLTYPSSMGVSDIVAGCSPGMPAANDDEFCSPSDDDPCQEWYDELLELYKDILSGKAAASAIEKHLYNKSVDSYHANCPGYPRLTKF